MEFPLDKVSISASSCQTILGQTLPDVQLYLGYSIQPLNPVRKFKNDRTRDRLA